MKKYTLAAALLLAVVASTNAAIVANFDFTNGANSSDTESFSTATPITAVGFTFVTNATLGNPAPSTEFRFADIANSAANPPGPAPLVATTDYFSFTLTPSSGFMLTFNTLTFDAANLSSSANANAFSVSLQVSQNGFNSNVGTAVINNNTAFQLFSFDLSGLTAATGAIEFRLVLRDNSASATLGGLIDNIVVNADVAAIPEPATYMLMGIGMLVCAQQFRRKKS